MRNVNFSKIDGLEGVAKYFYISSETLDRLVTAKDQTIFYEQLKIRKRSPRNDGKFRVVYKANSAISQFQKNVATAISQTVNFPKHVQGFVKKRSPSTNALQHLECKLLMNADITNFFDSIAIASVIKIFKELGCNENTSYILAKACTLNGFLCQGLHTSPILSNLVVEELDNDIQKLCQKHSAVYTRYSDDIAISSKVSLPTKEELQSVLTVHGFQMNESKFRISRRGQSQYVTGLSVFDSLYPRIPKRIKRRLRLELYYINKYGLEKHFDKIGLPDYAENFWYNRIRGTVDYINAVEPDLAEKYYELLPDRPNYAYIAKLIQKNPEKLTKRLKLELGLDNSSPNQ